MQNGDRLLLRGRVSSVAIETRTLCSADNGKGLPNSSSICLGELGEAWFGAVAVVPPRGDPQPRRALPSIAAGQVEAKLNGRAAGVAGRRRHTRKRLAAGPAFLRDGARRLATGRRALADISRWWAGLP